jgi:DNA adenine methylase Dam
MNFKVCENCNKQFIPNSNRQKYCHDCRVLFKNNKKVTNVPSRGFNNNISFINYVGNKSSFGDFLVSKFPDNINTLIEPFVGSGVISLKTVANSYILNDKLLPLFKIYKWIEKGTIENLLTDIKLVVDKFNINRLTNNINDRKAGFNKLKDLTNNKNYQTGLYYYVLTVSCFNNNLAIKKNGGFTGSLGINNSFNKSLEIKLRFLKEWLDNNNVTFSNKDYLSLNYNNFNSNDFIYLDPPYLLSTTFYGKKWNRNDDYRLYKLCDKLNNEGINFGLSNVVKKGININNILNKWMGDYKVYFPNVNYNNNFSDKEVYVTNVF